MSRKKGALTRHEPEKGIRLRCTSDADGVVYVSAQDLAAYILTLAYPATPKELARALEAHSRAAPSRAVGAREPGTEDP